MPNWNKKKPISAPSLLARKEFHDAVLARDRNRCVICRQPADTAHHIMERKLWPNGGYYMENGASVCAQCHWDCELNIVTPQELRDIIGLPTILPPGMDYHLNYDKWGRVIKKGEDDV